MSSLLEEFAGKIDLIYIDPPFATDFVAEQRLNKKIHVCG
jgi:16S rRNA G966 N2-methylase RsmD